MVFYTDDPIQLNQRRALGINWNTVPSMALNTLHHTIYTYEKDLPFDQENIEQWLISLRKGTAKQTLGIGESNDKTLYDVWLSNTIVATRKSWDDEILRDREHDCVIFFYSSANISYQQRGYAFQYALTVQKALQEEAGQQIEVVKFYSYDVHVQGYPKGIHRGNGFPEDTDGSMDGTVELEMSGLPKLYILPAKEKGMPYR